MFEPTYYDAVNILTDYKTLHGTAAGPISKITLEKDVVPPTEEAIQTQLAELLAGWDAQEYARNRASAYPSNGDQWDMIYKDNKNGTTTHADAVEAVKTKWPKDNSGPIE
jgi:hypothetical protein